MSISSGKTKLKTGSLVSKIVAFSTTDATVEVPCGGLKRVIAVATAAGTPAADEILSINETVTDGMYDVPASGTITLTRTGASKTSALKVAVLMTGY